LEERKFWIEKILDRVPLPYTITSALLGAFLYFIWLVVAIRSELEFSVFAKDPWFIIISSFIAFLLGAMKYISNDIRRLSSRVREIFDMTDVDFESFFIRRHKSIFSSRHLVVGIPIIITFLVYAYLTRSYWIHREYNFAIYLTGVVYWILICLIFGMASWCAGWGFQFYWWVGRKAPLRLRPLRADKVGGLSPITQQHLKATFLMAVGMSFLILLFETARFVISGFCIFLILFYFFAPQYHLHQPLAKLKKKTLEEIGRRLYERSADFLRTLDDDSANKKEISQDIQTLKLLLTNIDRMREWPFDFGIALKAIGSAMLPILVFVLDLLPHLGI